MQILMSYRTFFHLDNIRRLLKYVIMFSVHNLKKTSILLVNCPCSSVEAPSLSLASLAGHLKQQADVHILDISIEIFDRADNDKKKQFDPEISDHLWSTSDHYKDGGICWEKEGWDLLFRKCSECSPDIVGFSIYRSNTYFAINMVSRLKEQFPDIVTVFGGPECTVKYNELLKSECIDFVVIGEGEEPLEELVHAFEETRNSMSEQKQIIVPGDCFRKNEIIEALRIDNEKKDVSFTENYNDKSPFSTTYAEFNRQNFAKTYFSLRDIREYGVPDYSGFPLHKYSRSMMYLLMSRGCPGRCRFCSGAAYYPHYRRGNRERIKAELQNFKDMGIEFLSIVDAYVNADREMLECLLEVMEELDYSFEWQALVKATGNLNSSTLKRMHKLGCRGFSIGVESGSNHVLKLMAKDTDRASTLSLIRDAGPYTGEGIFISVNYIVGFPGESFLDFLFTLYTLIILRKNISSVRVTSFSAAPLTPMHKWALKKTNVKFYSGNPISEKTFRRKIIRNLVRLMNIEIIPDYDEKFLDIMEYERRYSFYSSKGAQGKVKALKYALKLRKLEPKNEHYAVIAALCLFDAGYHLKGIKAFEKMIRKGIIRRNSENIFKLARLYYDAGELNKCIHLLKSIVHKKENPSFPEFFEVHNLSLYKEILCLLTCSFARTGNKIEARKMLEEIQGRGDMQNEMDMLNVWIWDFLN